MVVFEKVCRFVNESRLLTNLNDEPMLTAVKYDPYLTIITIFLRKNNFYRKILRSEITYGQKTFRLFHSIKKHLGQYFRFSF